jgi:hypothetical protein
MSALNCSHAALEAVASGVTAELERLAMEAEGR